MKYNLPFFSLNAFFWPKSVSLPELSNEGIFIWRTKADVSLILWNPNPDGLFFPLSYVIYMKVKREKI